MVKRERDGFRNEKVYMMAYAALALAVLAWGLEYPLMKSVTDSLGPLGIGAVMFTVATLLLGLQLGVRGIFRREHMPNRRMFGYMVLIGFIGFIANISALFAIDMTSVTNVATLARTDVLFSLILAGLVFHEKIEWSAWLATPLMLAGICLLTGIFSTSLDKLNGGDFLVLLSAFSVAVNAYIIRHTAQKTDPALMGIVNTAINSILFVSAVILLPSGNNPRTVLINGFTNPVALTLGGLAALFFIGYYIALKALPVWKVRLLMLLIPVVAAVSGRVLLGEIVTVVQMLGIAFICSGAMMVIIIKKGNKNELD